MRITIFDKQDKKAYTLPVNTESTYIWELMQEEYITVRFQSDTILKLRKGYWCEIDGLGRFEVVDLPKPDASEIANGWNYELRLDRPWYRFKNRIYFFSRNHAAGMEVNWSLTDTIEQHAALLVQSINDIGLRYGNDAYEVAIAQSINLEESRLVQFDKTSILDAISAIAEAFECEWWIDENTIHFGRCETGEAITLEVGKEIKRPLTRQDDSTEKHGTRLYAFGSSRNLNANYRRELNNPFHIDGFVAIQEGTVRIRTMKPTNWYSASRHLKFMNGRYAGETYPFNVVSGTYTEEEWASPVFEIDLGISASDNGFTGTEKIQFIIEDIDEQTEDSVADIIEWHRDYYNGFSFTDLQLPKMAITSKTRMTSRGSSTEIQYIGTVYDSEGNLINDGRDIYRRKDGQSMQPFYDGSVTLTGVALAYINRLYTKPIDGDTDIAIQGIAQTTLKLPIGTPYIDSEPNLPEDDITEVVRQYEHIYPRCLLTITDVEEVDATETDEDTGNVTHWTAYRFKAKMQDETPYVFDNGYILPGEDKPLSIHFESGRLNGMDFEVAFNPNGDDARLFEIVRNDTYTLQLPNETAKPEVGDTLFMYNMDVTFIDDTLIAAAENELLTQAQDEMVELAKDDGTYTANTNPVLCKDKRIDLAYGRMVTLVAPEYFHEKDNYRRTTRVIGWSKRLDDPYQAEYTIGEASAYSPYGALANDIEEVIYLNTQNEIAKSAGGSGSKKTEKKLGEKLSRVTDDTALGHITFNKGLTSREVAKLLKGAFFGAFAEGLRGGRIDGNGNAELNELITRAKAVLAQLQVKGTAQFDGNLFSTEFISGFLTGKGWGITKEKVKNALGVEETKYTGEFDNIICRGALRVFTFVVSQMLGENDNRVFTAMLEVDHYDPATGKVWLDTKNGKLYNPFRVGDYIMVQQYNGMPSPENQYYITKHYECIITGAGMGNLADGENRLDWVTFKNFVTANEDTATNLIKKGDTFVRVDNETDADRKGIIQVMTVGSATPYIDIAYGLKTDPDNALKGRIGNLQGIYNPLFGQLEGFGELLINLYAVGDFKLRRTGESVDVQIQMLKSVFSTRYQKQIYQLTEEDNYLTNATFDENMDGWTKDDDENTKLLTYTDGEPIILNGSIVSTGEHRANLENYEGQAMLHLQATGITQANTLIRKPSTHKEYETPTTEKTTESRDVQDTLYINIKFLPMTNGELTIGMKGSGATDSERNSLPYTQGMVIEKSKDWQTLQWEGTWNGMGDFYLHFSGEAYISHLSLTDRPLAEFKKTVNTQIIQSAENILLLGRNIDETNNTVTNLGIELRAADREIRLYVDTETADLERRLGIVISDTERAVKIYAEEYTKGAITENNRNYYTRSEIDITVNGINTYVIGVRDELTIKINGDINQLQTQVDAANVAIQNAQNATNELHTYVDGAFADGIIDEAEKIGIEKYLKTIAGTKLDIDSTYADLINNANFNTSSTEYANLISAKRSVDTTYNALYTAIANAIVDGKATNSEIAAVNTAFDNFNNAIGTFSTRVEESNEAIQRELKKYTDDKVAWVKGEAERLAREAAEAETYEQPNNPWNSWSAGTEHTHIGAVWTFTGSNNTVKLKDAAGNDFYAENGGRYRYIGYNTNTWEDLADIAYAVSYTIQNEDYISTVLANFDKNGNLSNAGGQVISAYGSRIWATTQTVNTLDGKVSRQQAQIDVQATQISQRVEKDGIISAINQSAESVKISASKIKLEGYTSINETFIVDNNGIIKLGNFQASRWGLTNIVTRENMSRGDMAYIICRNDYYGRFAGIGANVLPATSGDTSAVGRFENTDTHGWYGSNIAILLNAQNGTHNYAFIGTGNGLLNGAIIGYKVNEFTPTNSNNTIPLDNGNRVLLKGSSYTTCYLPTLQACREFLGINSSTHFAMDLIIMGASGSQHTVFGYVSSSYGADCPHLRDNDEYQDKTGGIGIHQGDILHLVLVYDGSFNAYIISWRD